MPAKSKTIAMISAAFIAGCALTASLFITAPAAAEEDDCRFQDMPFNSTSSALTDNEIAIKYVLPRCLMTRGYKIVAVDVESDQRIQVHYKKPNYY